MATGGGEGGLSDECFDVNCTICAKKKRVKEAVRYCSDCRKNLCNDCVEIHNDYNEGHTIVDGHGNDAEVNLLTEKCDKHTDKLIELFCVGHDALVCSICALLEHRKCDDLKHITDSFEDLNKTLHAVPGQLKTSLQNVDKVITALQQHTEELSEIEHKFLEEIEEYTRRLLAKIETLQQNARREISSKHEQAASEATEKMEICTTAKADIMRCMDNMKSAGNRKAHLFILKKKGHAMTKNVETLCRESENMMKTVKFMVEPDWRIEETLNEFMSLATERDKYKVSLKVNIDASVKNDSKPGIIMGCCLLPDGTLLLTDDNNNRFKHVDPTDSTVKYNFHLAGKLRGITCISPQEVAVSTFSTYVQIVSLGNNIRCTAKIQLNHDFSRITHSNGELFTTLGNCVLVHDLTGTLLRTIYKKTSGEDMFSGIRGIALDETGDRLYVADRDMGLICTTRAGHEVFRRSEEQLGLCRAYGVCTDQRGNVLVCGYETNNVVQVTEDGRVIGEILSKDDGILNPRCLCFDAARRRLYVGGETSKLRMYQFM